MEKPFADQQINLLTLVNILVERKMLIVKACLVAIVASVGYSLTLPNIYSATATLLPPQKESSGLSGLLGQAGGLAGLAVGGLGGSSDLYVSILKSRSVGDAVIKKLDLAKVYGTDTQESTRRSLNAALNLQTGKDGVIYITTSDKEPKRAALLANTFIDELGNTTNRLNLSKAGAERMFLEERLALVSKDLKNAEDDLKQFAQQHKVVQVDSQAKASIEGIAQLKAELASKEVQLSVLRTQQVEKSHDVQALLAAINRLRGQISQLVGGGDPGQAIPSVGSVPSLGLEYARKLREVKTQEAILEQLTRQYEMAKLTEAKDSSTFQVLDKADVPVRKSKPARAVIVILATVTAFFASVVWIFAQEYLTRMSEEDRMIFNNIKRKALTFK